MQNAAFPACEPFDVGIALEGDQIYAAVGKFGDVGFYQGNGSARNGRFHAVAVGRA